MNINTCSAEYRHYLESEEWRAIRERILLRDDFKCRLCGSSEHLHCHHINGKYRFHEGDHPESLMVLCESCHTMIHSYYRVCDSIKEFYDKKRHEEQLKRGYY